MNFANLLDLGRTVTREGVTIDGVTLNKWRLDSIRRDIPFGYDTALLRLNGKTYAYDRAAIDRLISEITEQSRVPRFKPGDVVQCTSSSPVVLLTFKRFATSNSNHYEVWDWRFQYETHVHVDGYFSASWTIVPPTPKFKVGDVLKYNATNFDSPNRYRLIEFFGFNQDYTAERWKYNNDRRGSDERGTAHFAYKSYEVVASEPTTFSAGQVVMNTITGEKATLTAYAGKKNDSKLGAAEVWDTDRGKGFVFWLNVSRVATLAAEKPKFQIGQRVECSIHLGKAREIVDMAYLPTRDVPTWTYKLTDDYNLAASLVGKFGFTHDECNLTLDTTPRSGWKAGDVVQYGTYRRPYTLVKFLGELDSTYEKWMCIYEGAPKPTLGHFNVELYKVVPPVVAPAAPASQLDVEDVEDVKVTVSRIGRAGQRNVAAKGDVIVEVRKKSPKKKAKQD